MKFDVSVPKTVSGDVFTFENLLPIRALHAGQKDISVVGQVFAVNTREIKKTGKISISVGQGCVCLRQNSDGSRCRRGAYVVS